jgi:hypothetical protein
MESCIPTFRDEGAPFELAINDVALLKLISSNPVASVQFFKTLFEAFLYVLVGIPPPEQQDEVPINHPSRKGIWGIVTDILIVHETNGRQYTFYFSQFKLTSL